VSLLLLLLLLPPGAVRPLTAAQVCATRWGTDRRQVTEAMKREVAKRDGVRWADRARYEFDHLVPRELGGADTVDNLWPQPLAEATVKDRLENRLHRLVCTGQISLADAQNQMRHYRPPAVAPRR